MRQKFKTVTDTVGKTKQVTSNCVDILFINNGTATATIMGQVLETDESLRIAGNIGEIDHTMYKIEFGSTGTKSVNVIKRIYVD